MTLVVVSKGSLQQTEVSQTLQADSVADNKAGMVGLPKDVLLSSTVHEFFQGHGRIRIRLWQCRPVLKSKLRGSRIQQHCQNCNFTCHMIQ